MTRVAGGRFWAVIREVVDQTSVRKSKVLFYGKGSVIMNAVGILVDVAFSMGGRVISKGGAPNVFVKSIVNVDHSLGREIVYHPIGSVYRNGVGMCVGCDDCENGGKHPPRNQGNSRSHKNVFVIR